MIYLMPFIFFSMLFRIYPKKKARDIYIDKVVTSFSHPSFTMKRIKMDFDNILEITKKLQHTDY